MLQNLPSGGIGICTEYARSHPQSYLRAQPLSLNNRPPVRPSRSQKAEGYRFLPRERLGRSRVSVSHSPAGQRDSQDCKVMCVRGVYVDLSSGGVTVTGVRGGGRMLVFESPICEPPAPGSCGVRTSLLAPVHTMAPMKRPAVKGVVCAIFLSHCAAFTLSPVPTTFPSSPVTAEHVSSRPSARGTTSSTSRFLPIRRVGGRAGGDRIPVFALGRCTSKGVACCVFQLAHLL